MGVSVTSKSDHYRALAERMLAEAGKTSDSQVKVTLLEIASRYGWLAEWTERQRRSS